MAVAAVKALMVASMYGMQVADVETDEVSHLAALANVDEMHARWAAATVGVSVRRYLEDEGLIPRPVPPMPQPSAAIAARVRCIELKESGGLNIPNRAGSPAGGVMQYFESTFRAHAVEMARALGRPEIAGWSRWNPEQARALAAWDLSKGRRAQWTVSGC